MLERLRTRAPRTEPERSLARLRDRGTRLHLETPDDQPRHGREEPDLQVAWWWHAGDRTVVLGGRRVVSILGPTEVRTRPLQFVEAERIVIVGGDAPAPGGVHRARRASLILDPQVPAWDTSPAPEPTTPTALAPLVGRTVELRIEGGSTADHGGVVLRAGTEQLPVPRGRLVEAVVGSGHVVLVLEDGAVAVLHEPSSSDREADGAVRLDGDLGRVVLDLPDAEVHVARDATLLVRPVGDDPPSRSAARA